MNGRSCVPLKQDLNNQLVGWAWPAGVVCQAPAVEESHLALELGSTQSPLPSSGGPKHSASLNPLSHLRNEGDNP